MFMPLLHYTPIFYFKKLFEENKKASIHSGLLAFNFYDIEILFTEIPTSGRANSFFRNTIHISTQT